VDLAIVGAIAFKLSRQTVPDRTVVMGEVGLTGEVRAIARRSCASSKRAKWAFNRCILPWHLKRLPRWRASTSPA